MARTHYRDAQSIEPLAPSIAKTLQLSQSLSRNPLVPIIQRCDTSQSASLRLLGGERLGMMGSRRYTDQKPSRNQGFSPCRQYFLKSRELVHSKWVYDSITTKIVLDPQKNWLFLARRDIFVECRAGSMRKGLIALFLGHPLSGDRRRSSTFD